MPPPTFGRRTARSLWLPPQPSLLSLWPASTPISLLSFRPASTPVQARRTFSFGPAGRHDDRDHHSQRPRATKARSSSFSHESSIQQLGAYPAEAVALSPDLATTAAGAAGTGAGARGLRLMPRPRPPQPAAAATTAAAATAGSARQSSQVVSGALELSLELQRRAAA